MYVGRKVTVAAAREYVSNGFNCVIDDGMFPGRVLARYARLDDRPPPAPRSAPPWLGQGTS